MLKRFRAAEQCADYAVVLACFQAFLCFANIAAMLAWAILPNPYRDNLYYAVALDNRAIFLANRAKSCQCYWHD
jgi:hypothetical protein